MKKNLIIILLIICIIISIGNVLISYGKFLGYQERDQEYINFEIKKQQDKEFLLKFKKEQLELYQKNLIRKRIKEIIIKEKIKKTV